MMRIRIAITFIFLLIYSCCIAISPPGPVPTYETEDIIWLEATDSYLVACWSDGTVCCWDTHKWDVRSKFKIQDFYFRYQELYISFNDRPVLASIYQWEKLSFYDLLSAKKINEKTFKGEDIDGKGFSRDGSKFYCSSTDAEYFLCLDVKTGKNLWKYKYDLKPKETFITADEELFVDVFHSKSEGFALNLIARNPKGEIKWNSGNSYKNYHCTGYYSYPYWNRSAPKPALPASTALFGSFKDEREMLAISLENGEVLWEKKLEEGEKLWAVTADRKKQVFANDGSIRVTNLPKNDEMSIIGQLEDSDAIITPNGENIYCLPKLRMVKYDIRKGVKKLARTSNILTVIDCKEGIFTKEITLSKPILE